MSTKHRCSSCGYVGEIIDAYAPEVVAEVVAVVAVIIPAVVQQSRCPLCGELFEDPEEYTAHRIRNCAPAPVVDPPAEDPTGATGDPLVTDPNPAEPAEPQE
jgi:rubredoxin